MTPGLARGPPFPPRATKGSVVAIASLEKPSVPVVVGECEIDVAALQEVRGVKGHAVRGEHWEGDEIWAWGQSGATGRKAPDAIEGWDYNDGVSSPEERLGHVAVDDSEDEHGHGGVSVTPTATEPADDRRQDNLFGGEDSKPYEEVDMDEKELSIKGTWSLCPRTAVLIDKQVRDRRHLLERFFVWSSSLREYQSF